jgi:hypothetical protein
VNRGEKEDKDKKAFSFFVHRSGHRDGRPSCMVLEGTGKIY